MSRFLRQRLSIGIIVHHNMRPCGFFSHRHLCSDTLAGLLIRKPPVPHQPLHLHRLAGCEADDNIPLPSPAHLKQKRNDDSLGSLARTREPTADGLFHQRVNNAVQTFPRSSVIEHDRRKRQTVNTAILRDHAITEQEPYTGNGGTSRRLQFMYRVIGVQNIHSQLLEIVGKETLAACDTTRYSNTCDHAETSQHQGVYK